jgi:zinc protease
MKDNMYWMNALTKNQMSGSDKYEILNYEEKVKALTAKDLQEVGKKYLTKGRVVATLMPEDGWENAKKDETKPEASVIKTGAAQ